MRIGYYPGCSLLGSSREFDESARAVLRALDVEMVEVPDWSCCGASSAHVLNHMLSLVLPARILILAEQAGLHEILAPCAACSNRLISAQDELKKHPELMEEIQRIIDMPYQGTVRVINILEVLDRYREPIAARIREPFKKKVASYYGCLLVRPPKVVRFDRPEDPQSMDRLVEAVGGTCVEWPFKTECCGAAFSITRTDIVAKLSGKLVKDVVKRGADVIAVACPMCHSNLDLRRGAINAFLGEETKIPVMFITQIIGRSMGLGYDQLGLQRHMVAVD